MMFRAEEWGWRERDTNPCLGIRKNPRRQIARFLDAEELQRLGRARDGSIAANADGGWLHNLGGDAYFVRPACFEEFATIEGVEVRTIKNRVAKLRQHRLRKWERGVANTFRAELRDGRRVEGMLFPGELIWNDEAPLLAGAELR